jgi:NitT/TauT family transport system ATP-binding protein
VNASEPKSAPANSPPQTTPPRPLIAAEDLAFWYGAARRNAAATVLEDVSFTLHEGECLCVLGPTGCGKTTLLRLLAGFEMPSAGTLTLEDQDIAGPGRERAVVFQGDRSLFDWLSVENNVAFGLRMAGMPRSERRELARRVLASVGLEGQGSKYPAALSGGMKQRVQIARVLANQARILLMDEPFGALDAQTRSVLQDELIRIKAERNLTIFFITHDIAEAVLLGDRIAVMRRAPNSTISTLIDVDLPRPRSRAHVAFGELYEHLNSIIRAEGMPS